MEERRRCTTVRQLEVLLDFLSTHKDLALGRVRSKEARAVSARLWRECAEILNSLGPARTGKEWAKVWNDQKCRVRSKLVAINANYQATGGGPSNAPSLSPLEEKIANIIGRDVGPMSNVRQNHFASVGGGDMMMEEEVVFEVATEQPPVASEPNFTQAPTVLNIQSEELPLPQPSPEPSLSGQAPSPQPQSESTADRVTVTRGRRRAERVARQPTGPSQAPSNRSTLDESRAMLLKIEEMKARTELLNAQSMSTFAESFRLIAESVDRMSRQFFFRRQEDE